MGGLGMQDADGVAPLAMGLHREDPSLRCWGQPWAPVAPMEPRWAAGLWGMGGTHGGQPVPHPALHGRASVTTEAMAAQPSRAQKPFHIVSPVLESLPLSRAAGTKVYMKLENVQPTGSFKIRGIGHLCQEVRVPGRCSCP